MEIYRKTISRLLTESGKGDKSKFDKYFVSFGYLWGENISSHPWKDRVYDPVKIMEISDQDATDLVRLCEIEQAEDQRTREEAAREEERRHQERLAWLKSLPDEIEDLVVNRKTGELCDSCGNYYLTLPDTPIDNIGQWVRDNIHIPE